MDQYLVEVDVLRERIKRIKRSLILVLKYGEMALINQQRYRIINHQATEPLAGRGKPLPKQDVYIVRSPLLMKAQGRSSWSVPSTPRASI